MRPTILFSGGGTLGSVTPLLAVSQVLKQRRPDWVQVWVGTLDGPERQLIEPQMAFYAMPTVKFRRYLSWATVTDIFRVPSVYRLAQRLASQLQPTVVVGAGGYVTVPIAVAAKRHGSKLLIHQQDVIPGLANRLLARWADQITVATASGQAVFPPEKTTWTGNPTRFDSATVSAARGRTMFSLAVGRPLVVVLGGGTGAEALNVLVDRLRPILSDRVTIFHITGPSRGREVVTTSNYVSRPFVNAGMGDVLAAATVVVSRAGMGTLTELSALGKTAIVIPIPDSHQVANADALQLQQAAEVVRQDDSPEQLANLMLELLNDSVRSRRLGEHLRDWNRPGAAATLCRLIEELAQP